MATPTSSSAKHILDAFTRVSQTEQKIDAALAHKGPPSFAEASRRWKNGTTPIADSAVFRPKGQPLFLQDPTDAIAGLQQYRFSRPQLFTVRSPRVLTPRDIRNVRTFRTPTPISTNLPDEFVQHFNTEFQKWIEDADRNPYVQKVRFFSGMGLHLNGTKGRWTVEMAQGPISLKNMNHWLETTGVDYDGRYWETLEENYRRSAGKSRLYTCDGTPTCPCVSCGFTHTILAPAARASLARQNQALWFGFDPAQEEPRPPLPRTSGVVAGEIVAYRAWKLIRTFDGPGHLARVQQDKHQWRLTSMYQDDVWLPGCPLENRRPDDHGENGVHAWKDLKGKEFFEYVRYYHSKRALYFSCIVTGSVKLWGDVVEHEKGYRAEFAKINSIDWLYPNAGTFGREQQVLEELRKLYGV